MKEKTFEELIEEKENMNVPNFIHFNDVLELLQKVREATIAECKNIPLKWVDVCYDEVNKDMITEPEVNIEAFDNLPTDRIINP